MNGHYYFKSFKKTSKLTNRVGADYDCNRNQLQLITLFFCNHNHNHNQFFILSYNHNHNHDHNHDYNHDYHHNYDHDYYTCNSKKIKLIMTWHWKVHGQPETSRPVFYRIRWSRNFRPRGHSLLTGYTLITSCLVCMLIAVGICCIDCVYKILRVKVCVYNHDCNHNRNDWV